MNNEQKRLTGMKNTSLSLSIYPMLPLQREGCGNKDFSFCLNDCLSVAEFLFRTLKKRKKNFFTCIGEKLGKDSISKEQGLQMIFDEFIH